MKAGTLCTGGCPGKPNPAEEYRTRRGYSGCVKTSSGTGVICGSGSFWKDVLSPCGSQDVHTAFKHYYKTERYPAGLLG